MTLKLAVLRTGNTIMRILYSTNQTKSLLSHSSLQLLGSGVLEYMEIFQSLTGNAAQPEPTNQLQA